MACCGGFGLFNGLGLNAQPGLCSSYGGGGCCYNPSYGGLAFPTWAWGFGPGCWPIAPSIPCGGGGGFDCNTSCHSRRKNKGRRNGGKNKNRV